MTHIVGIHGRKGHGKNTTADILTEILGGYTSGEIKQYAFADPLKRGLQTMFGLTDEQVFGGEKEPVIPWLGKSPRQLLQTLGTEWGRTHVHSNVWVDATLQRIDTEAPTIALITDVRFPNEAQAIRARQGVVWQVIRPDLPESDGHPSEDGLDAMWINDTVHNSGTIKDLRQLVMQLVSRLVVEWDHLPGT